MPLRIVLASIDSLPKGGDYYREIVPQGLTTMAVWLEREGHHLSLMNFTRENAERAAKLTAGERPDIVGVSILTHNRAVSLDFVREIKKRIPGVPLVIGGPHAAFLAGEIQERFPEVDLVVTGEGEAAMARIARLVAQGEPLPRVMAGDRLDDLDEIPWPAAFRGKLYGIDPHEQYKFLVTSRGCPWDCTYCASPAFWGRRVTSRGAENILGEIRYLYSKFGILYFAIRDDNFTLSKKRVLEFSSLLAKESFRVMWNCQGRVESVDDEMLVAMKSAGLEHIQFGIESGSPAIMKSYDKRVTPELALRASRATRLAGIQLSAYFMTGMEGETADDITRSGELIRLMAPDDIMVSPVALYPGTRLFADAESRNTVSRDIWFSSSDEGVFLRNDRTASRWPAKLSQALVPSKERDFGKRFFRETQYFDWVGALLAADHYRYRGDYTRAGEWYGRVIASEARSVWAWLKKGKNDHEAGRFADALDSFSHAGELLPCSPVIKLYGSLSAEAAGEISLAKRLAFEAVRLNPRSKAIVENEKRLK